MQCQLYCFVSGGKCILRRLHPPHREPTRGGSLRAIFRPHQIAGPVKQNKRARRKAQESSQARKVLGFFFHFWLKSELLFCFFFLSFFFPSSVFCVSRPSVRQTQCSAGECQDVFMWLLSSHTGPFATMTECRRSCCCSLRRTHAHTQARTELQ